MAHIESTGGGRKKNFEVNLVPFIDLMSVLITFLLITAVWTQVSMIQIGTSIVSKKNQDMKPPVIPPDADVVLKLEIRPNGYTLFMAKEVVNVPVLSQTTGAQGLGPEYDDSNLLIQLKKFKEKYPNKIDGAITMSDELPYEKLIKGMDSFLKAGFPSISVLTGGPN